MPKVAICTVNWNRKDDTLDFLQSLKKLDVKGLEVKVFLVDGGSTDGSVEDIKSLGLKSSFLDLISRDNNRGTAGGYNDGVKAALIWGADYFFLVNNDILFKDPRLLQKLIQALESDPKIGIVSPKILFAPGFEFYKERYSKKDIGHVIWYAGGHFNWKIINSSHRGIDEVDTGKYDRVEETELISGSALLVRKEIFLQGIFWDEVIFAYFDDNDFQEKVKQAGYKLFYDGRTAVYHKVSRTGGIGSPTSDYYLSRNKLIFGLRYAPLRTRFALFREAIKLLFTGRPNQRKGVADFFLGKRGKI